MSERACLGDLLDALRRDLDVVLEAVPEEMDLEEYLECLCDEASADGGAECRCAGSWTS